MRKMRLHRLALGERFAGDHRGTKDDITLHQAASQGVGKAQYVGRVVAIAISTVEIPGFGRPDDPHGDLGRAFERSARPTADLGRSRDGGGARGDLKMEREARFAPAARSSSLRGVGPAAGRHGGYSSP